VRVPVNSSPELTPGTYQWPIMVGYQICQEFGQEVCFLPEDKEITVSVNVVPSGTGVNIAHQEVFAEEKIAEVPKDMTLEERLIDALERGSWLAFLLVFVGGILTSFTPCVYPVIPLTIGYIGGASTGKPLKGLALAGIFVLGIAVVYSGLGLLSAATGTLFGSISGSPVVTYAVAAIFVLMGFSMLGAFEIALPSSVQTKLQGSGPRTGLIGPLVMGMVSGLIMAPCVGPVIVALLAWVAQSGNLFYGWALLFVFSLGLGLLFLVIGTFAGALQALPKAGAWMDAVKHGFGWILLAGALYLLRLTIPEPYYTLSWGLFLIVFSVFMGVFDSLKADAGAGARIWKSITVVTLILGAIAIFKVFGPAATDTALQSHREVEWTVNNETEAVEQALQEGKPLLIDVYADWCVACVELDEKTYIVPEVIERLDRFVRLKLDFTKETEWVRDMKRKYRITGMPTVIFINSDGEELTRFTGFKPAPEFIALLDKYNL
ncbi:thioredoxin family protein, partial [bacterium]|nr:thioredoxin family protein [bacterium]